MPKPVVLDSIPFSEANDPKRFFRDMLYRYPIGSHVSDPDGVHLLALLQYHTEADEKIGCGIDHFEVMAAQYGTRCFKRVRTDGTSDDFSMKNPIKAATNAKRM